jgi:hypothetical protein
MSNYFSYFPNIQHDLTNVGQKVQLTNILRRFKVKEGVKDRTDVYYEYEVQAGDRPDTIAEKYYGDSSYAWIVLHYNEIQDPVFGWALFNQEFDDYIKGKYGACSCAQKMVHEYRQILNQKQIRYDGTVIPERYVVVDKETYDTLDEENKQLITKYDWELQENENKRKIKILDKRYLSQIVGEVEDILRNGI